MKSIGRIYDYKIKIVSDNKTITKTKEEREREKWFKELSEYWGEKETKFKEYNHTDIIVYISEPTFEYFAKCIEQEAMWNIHKVVWSIWIITSLFISKNLILDHLYNRGTKWIKL